MTDLTKTNNYLFRNVTPFNYPCTKSDFLIVSSVYNSFVRERTATAQRHRNHLSSSNQDNRTELETSADHYSEIR